MSDNVALIRELNDKLRTQFVGGQIMLTAAVDALDPQLKAKVLSAVRTFNNFNGGNDPHQEHDFGTVEVERETYFFKHDYYAPDMQHGSEAPHDPARTRRVLTLGHMSDY
jgi:Protein of unknown function (DUF3768)